MNICYTDNLSNGLAGKNIVSKEFRQHAMSMAISTKRVPVEAHWSIGLVERAHPALRRAYQIITRELQGTGVSKESALQMAVKAVNDTAGPDGLVPTLLVFGAYPRMSELDPQPPQSHNEQQRYERQWKKHQRSEPRDKLTMR